jgi:uncharacterized glyoxalase superfamily protein PhnB
MISDADSRSPMHAFFNVTVEDVDSTCRRAIDAGARSFEGLTETPSGDRRGVVEDNWSDTWHLATFRESA